MQTEHTSQNEVTLSLSSGEEVQQHILEGEIRQAQSDPEVWNVFLILPPEVANVERFGLINLGFHVAGNVSIDNVTFLKLKKILRRSSDGRNFSAGDIDLAVPAPALPRSDAEWSAIRLMEERYGKKPAI